MNCVRIIFDDGVIYDCPFSKEELDALTKSECLIKAITVADSWHALVSKECGMPESFICRVEWFKYRK